MPVSLFLPAASGKGFAQSLFVRGWLKVMVWVFRDIGLDYETFVSDYIVDRRFKFLVAK